MTAANEVRRSVMLMAWAAKRAEPTRSFSSCLKDAWAYDRSTERGLRLRLSGASPREATPTARGEGDEPEHYAMTVLRAIHADLERLEA